MSLNSLQPSSSPPERDQVASPNGPRSDTSPNRVNGNDEKRGGEEEGEVDDYQNDTFLPLEEGEAESLEKQSPTHVHSSATIGLGSEIEINDKNTGTWHLGKIVTINNDGTYDVSCHDGESKLGVEKSLIRLAIELGKDEMSEDQSALNDDSALANNTNTEASYDNDNQLVAGADSRLDPKLKKKKKPVPTTPSDTKKQTPSGSTSTPNSKNKNPNAVRGQLEKELQDKLDQALKRETELKTQLSETVKELTKSQESQKHDKAEIDRLTLELDGKKTSIESLENQLNEAKNEMGVDHYELSREAVALRERVRIAEKALKILEVKNTEMDEEMKNIVTQKELVDDEKRDLMKKMRKLQEKCNETEAKLEGVVNEKNSLEVTLSELRAEFEDQKLQAANQLEGEKAAYSAELQKLSLMHRLEIDEKNSQLNKLQEEYTSLDGFKHLRETELDSARETIDSLKSTIMTNQATCDELNRKLVEASNEFEATLEDMKSEYSAENSRLKTELQDANKKVFFLEKHIDDLKIVVTADKQKLVDVLLQLDVLQNKRMDESNTLESIRLQVKNLALNNDKHMARAHAVIDKSAKVDQYTNDALKSPISKDTARFMEEKDRDNHDSTTSMTPIRGGKSDYDGSPNSKNIDGSNGIDYAVDSDGSMGKGQVFDEEKSSSDTLLPHSPNMMETNGLSPSSAMQYPYINSDMMARLKKQRQELLQLQEEISTAVAEATATSSIHNNHGKESLSSYESLLEREYESINRIERRELELLTEAKLNLSVVSTLEARVRKLEARKKAAASAAVKSVRAYGYDEDQIDADKMSKIRSISSIDKEKSIASNAGNVGNVGVGAAGSVVLKAHAPEQSQRGSPSRHFRGK